MFSAPPFGGKLKSRKGRGKVDLLPEFMTSKLLFYFLRQAVEIVAICSTYSVLPSHTCHCWGVLCPPRLLL